MTEPDVREALRSWIAERNPELPPGEPADDTRLIELRYLTSLQVADLLLFVEELRQEPIDPASLRPGVFRSIDTIHSAFFS